jgi:hypothetical protein
MIAYSEKASHRQPLEVFPVESGVELFKFGWEQYEMEVGSSGYLRHEPSPHEPLVPTKYLRVSPSGKASAFDADIRWFKSIYPCLTGTVKKTFKNSFREESPVIGLI